MEYPSLDTMLGVHADWQESFRAESPEVLTPLLGKIDGSNAESSSEAENKSNFKRKKHDTETVKALLSMSAVDTPLLMLAFAAGNSLHCLSCVCCCSRSSDMSCCACQQVGSAKHNAAHGGMLRPCASLLLNHPLLECQWMWSVTWVFSLPFAAKSCYVATAS